MDANSIQAHPASPNLFGGSLIHPRYFNTATLLTDGRVVLAGGLTPDITDSCEVYDPATNTWTDTGSLQRGRYGHRSVLLADGRVLIMGGAASGSNAISSAEIYDPATSSWSSTGNMLSARTNFDAVLLASGKVLVAGGILGASDLSACEIYDPATGNWAATGSLLQRRDSHHLTELVDGRVLVAGGFSQTEGTLSQTELYDPVTGTWSASGSLSIPRTNNIQVRLADGRVLVAGGIWRIASHRLRLTGSTELYDPATGRWTRARSLHVARIDFTANLLRTGRVFVTGGSNGTILPENSIEEFDPSLGSWRISALTLSTGRRIQTATTLSDGSIIVAGGVGLGSLPLPDAELFVRP